MAKETVARDNRPLRRRGTAVAELAQIPWAIHRWRAPVAVALAIVALLSTRPTVLWTPISGAQFAERAVRTQRQHVQGELALEIRSESQQAVNDWLAKASPFSFVLPASSPAPEEDRPYRPKVRNWCESGSPGVLG